MKIKKQLSNQEHDDLLAILQSRFEQNVIRHKDIEWAKVQQRLEANPEKLWSMKEMEKSGGEPDCVGFDSATGEYLFFDCAPESPKGRRSSCYDRAALDSRKEHKPASSAMEMAETMGIELLNEDQYRQLQQLGNFDLKT